MTGARGPQHDDASAGSGPVVFVSYSREDAEWMQRFVKMLEPERRRLGLEVWFDTAIATGREWRADIDAAITRADVALLLVSAEFLASDFIMDVELPALEARGVPLAGVLLRECRYEVVDERARVQWAHDPVRDGPIAAAGDIDGAISDIVAALVGMLDDRQPERGQREALIEQAWSGVLGPDGLPLGADSDVLAAIVTDVRSVTLALIRKLAADPRLVYSLTPRQFEEVVAELLGSRGYDITLTPASRDGGVDIYAAKQSELGSFLYLVECKRYAPENKVGVGLIRELLGVVAQQRATAGILATTSFFTAGAQELQRDVKWQLSLKDYADVEAWLTGKA